MDSREKKSCSFERIYFSRGSDSYIYQERKNLGKFVFPQILKSIDNDISNSVFSFIPNTAETSFYGMTEAAEDFLNEQKTAKILSKIIDEEKPGLVISGKQAIDGDNNQTGQMLAALTDMPQGTFASKIEIDSDKIHVTREIDGGLQTIKLNMPAIITTDLRLNEPRYASLPNIMKAKKKPIETINSSDFSVDIKPRIQQIKVEEPPKRKAGIKVANVAELVQKLKNEAKVI